MKTISPDRKIHRINSIFLANYRKTTKCVVAIIVADDGDGPFTTNFVLTNNLVCPTPGYLKIVTDHLDELFNGLEPGYTYNVVDVVKYLTEVMPICDMSRNMHKLLGVRVSRQDMIEGREIHLPGQATQTNMFDFNSNLQDLLGPDIVVLDEGVRFQDITEEHLTDDVHACEAQQSADDEDEEDDPCFDEPLQAPSATGSSQSRREAARAARGTPEETFEYAAYVLKGRWPRHYNFSNMAESKIAKYADLAYRYSVEVVGAPWPNTENGIHATTVISNSQLYREKYNKFVQKYAEQAVC